MPLSSDPVLPVWFVLPLALLSATIVGTHLMLLQNGEIPPSRRRIRTANGLITLLVIPLIAYLFGIVSPAEKREFLLATSASVGLLFIILVLAGVDIANNLRLHAGERLAHRERLRRLRSELREMADGARPVTDGAHAGHSGYAGGDHLRYRSDDSAAQPDN